MTTENQDLKVDSTSFGDDGLKIAMQNLRKPRQVPLVAKPTSKAKPQTKKAKSKKAKTKSVEEVNPTGPPDDIDVIPDEGFDLKGQLTLKEMRFLEFFFTGEYTREKAMDLAGYSDLHPRYKYFLASKILQKHESSVGDARKIMRAMGYGETKVIEMLIDSAENAKSEVVRLNARVILAKCLGMMRETMDIQTGISIIIQPNQTPPPEPNGGNRMPALGFRDKEALPGPKPLEIVK